MTNLNEPSEECPFIEVMEVVGGKWRGSIIHCLAKGPKRFNELRRELGPITQKVQTQELRALERDGLVHREQQAESPPHVVYSITELGRTLVPILQQVSDWRRNIPEVAKARALHDARIEPQSSPNEPASIPEDS